MGHIFSPEALALARSLVCPGLVRTKDADVDVCQRNDDGTGEGRRVNDMGHAELLGVVDSIGQDEPAFGVGVQDFNGLAGHSGLDVAGFLRFSAGHIFRGRHDRRSLSRWVLAPRALA